MMISIAACGLSFFIGFTIGISFFALCRNDPKRWTWEDRKAGRLPEVCCKCVGILSEAIKRVVS